MSTEKVITLNITLNNKESAEATVKEIVEKRGFKATMLELQDEKGNAKFMVKYDFPIENNVEKSFKACCSPNGCCNDDEPITRKQIYEIFSSFESYFYQSLASEINWINQKISYIKEDFWDMQIRLGNHINLGHIPPINSPSQLKHALSVLGVGDDYEVYKKPIFTASKG